MIHTETMQIIKTKTCVSWFGTLLSVMCLMLHIHFCYTWKLYIHNYGWHMNNSRCKCKHLQKEMWHWYCRVWTSTVQQAKQRTMDKMIRVDPGRDPLLSMLCCGHWEVGCLSWSWPLTSSCFLGQECMELSFHSLCKPSWHGT